ncbi:MAG: hypothetical protein M1827_007186 [Pycnora praestabilis]|nr:MAG: hypothetical protein M1827_007186 [Pycnora praestabilis]
MAEMATPSAATISTSDPEASSPALAAERTQKPRPEKPEKPDEETYKSDLAKAEKDHSAVQERLNAIKAKIDLAKPPNKDSPTAKRQQELRSQLSAIRQQQQGQKTSRGSLQEKIRQLDATLKNRINEQKVARSRVSFKNVEEVDREIQRLEKGVDSGTMKLVDEKKSLADISSLRKQRKGFAGFDEAQKGIDDVKAQISDLRKGLDDPETRALSEKYSGIAKELDDIKADQDEAYKSINSLRDERTKIHAEQQEKYAAMRGIKDVYYQQKKAYADYEHEAYRQRKEKQKAERDSYEKEKRRKIADQKLEEASAPAYMDEILTAEGLIRYFDPSAAPASSKSSLPSKFAAHAQRTVDDSNIKGTRVMKKDVEEESYFAGTGGKKGKKGRKGGAAAAASPAPSTPTEGSGKFNLNMGVIEELGKVNVEAPMNQSDVPAVVEKLKEKLDHWKKDQDRKTKENIDKAQKEIDRLEADSSSQPAATSSSSSITSNNQRSTATAKKPATVNDSVNGHASADAELSQEKDGITDATEDLQKATIEDIAEE